MRNLKCVHHSRVDVASELPLTATTWSPENNSIICAHGPTKDKQIIELRRTRDTAASSTDTQTIIASWDAPCPLPDLEFDKIINLHHFGHNSTTCVVLAGGDLVVVRGEVGAGQEKIEIVGSVDGGIAAAAWSPDEELLVLVTRLQTVLFMTPDFDNVANAAFSLDDVKLSKHVSVGWGKSETQFKGKRAKALRDPTMPEKVDEGRLSPLDDGQVSLSWRGDGAFVAINSVENNTRRMIRIYSREGTLDSVSEPVDGLEGTVSWRPQGNLIAGLQRLDDQVSVVFFERNGLRHGQFTLTTAAKSLHPIKLSWNFDSTVLAVSYSDRVELWTMGNYHYYLKQVLHTGSEVVQGLLEPCWHPEESLRLLLAQYGTPGSIHQFRLVSDLISGPPIPPKDLGLTAVIDHKTLKLTPLRRANVPPPMALHEVELSDHVRDAAVNASSSRIAVLHDSSITVLTQSDPLRAPVVERMIDMGISSTMDPAQICFCRSDELFVLLFDWQTNIALLFDAQTGNISPLDEISTINRLFSSLDQQHLCLLNSNAAAVVNISPNQSSELELLCSFSTPTPWMEVLTFNDEQIVLARTSTGNLYANERLLIRNCTSFLVTKSHLLVTTTNHLLKFIHMAKVADLQIPPDEPETDERCRSVERGARLVSVMPSSYSVVLQMPRGNLETIFPRALVLAGIRSSINEKNYKKAFLACRNQRVDLNILHDHAPDQFLEHVGLVIDQIGKAEYIDLFLSQLRSEDVSQTLYKETLPQSTVNGVSQSNAITDKATQPESSKSDPAKVNRICNAFLASLSSDAKPRVQNIISAHVCKTPPDVEGGLRVITKLRESDPHQAETAVEHMCFLVDVNLVYERALGMYDLDMALLIAQQSQKDPREYLPHLQSLQEMSELRRKFTIDDQLGKKAKALGYLSDMQDFEGLQAYMMKNELYKEALDLCKYKPKEEKAVLRLYAEFLNGRNRFKEAGIAFEALSDLSAASEAYRAAIMWRESLSCASSVPVSDEEMRLLAESLVETLMESKDYTAAATIQLDYLKDVSSAARLFCKAYQFSEATRIVGLHMQSDLLESVVDPGLVESFATVTEMLADCKSQIGAQVPRLRELRQIKLQDPLAFYDGVETADIPDNVSLAPTDTSTSGGTFFTRYTNRTGTVNTTSSRKTSKNRRREERKRARGKKGSVYEEEYLVNSIGRLIQRINSISDDVGRLVQGLLRRSMRERASAVEAAMADVVKMCQDCVAEVYEVSETAAIEERGEDGEDRPVGADAVLLESMESAKNRKPPVVNGYTRSPLLKG